MHDTDRTNMEMEMEWEGEGEGYELDEYEGEMEGEFEFESEAEYESPSNGYGEVFDELEYEYESPLHDFEEMELAADFLEVMDDEELELFLGKVVNWAKKKYKKHVPRSVQRAVKKRLRRLAKRGLGIAGTAVGTYFGGPAGGAIGGKLASGAGRAFGLELEGMSPEDQEFEVARRFTRLSAEALKQAMKAPAGAPPNAVADKAVAIAVRKHAPGIAAGASAARKGRNSGVWKRRGKAIIIYGA